MEQINSTANAEVNDSTNSILHIETNKEHINEEGQQNREFPSEIPLPKKRTRYEPILRDMIALPNTEEETNGITIMTYNLLAQSLCKRELFPNCGDALKWKNRRPRLLKEIFHYLPDLGCFQEMDDTNFIETFKPEFEKFDYDSLFFKNDTKRHGCCIIWKKSKFTKLKELTLDFDKFGSPTMTTNCIGIVVVLGCVGVENKGISIGTTHLYWRPESMYERARQCLILYQNLLKLNEGFNFPAFLAGDFNSTPEDPIYQLMVKNSLTEKKLSVLKDSMRSFGDEVEGSTGSGDNFGKKEEKEKQSTSSTNEIIIEQSTTSSQSLTDTRPNQSSQSSSLTFTLEPSQLDSLLSNFENLPKCLSLYGQNYHLIDSENIIEYSEPKITHYGLHFKGTLDYIFYILDHEKENINEENRKDDENKFKVFKLLKLPRKEEFESTSLPNYKFNSDHVCLMVEIVGL
ncbi:38_t:CDS:2 [Funneliformis caledonium]|uniref:38_t:CDS:1 n=1 Tax=Funneliformis caledonium TaxID=1117310 RepID=A0A9N9B1U9_9GLOM|nr:38_t:CDS:2 [Funneliformis caledonium]